MVVDTDVDAMIGPDKGCGDQSTIHPHPRPLRADISAAAVGVL
jgi:hypothetical protein